MICEPCIGKSLFLTEINIIYDSLQKLQNDTAKFERCRIFTQSFPISAAKLQISSSAAISGLADDSFYTSPTGF